MISTVALVLFVLIYLFIGIGISISVIKEVEPYWQSKHERPMSINIKVILVCFLIVAWPVYLGMMI